uniref:Uncharacterized protein n=1 Tax=Helicotheca tamesis TaxID=374047 RepID=A0A7S2GW65_9STRA
MILEGRENMGGTWDQFRYPGIRLDSDLYTMAYKFRVWKGANQMAEGDTVLKYLLETADEYGVPANVRLKHMVKQVEWVSEKSTWTVEAEVDGEKKLFTCNFLYMCSGYFAYDEEKVDRPIFKDENVFKGDIVHPQFWPKDLNYKDKKVAIIGSGATAVTMVPAMSKRGAKVTMVQRTPTYMAVFPSVDWLPRLLSLFLPYALVFAITRWRNYVRARVYYKLSRTSFGPWLLKKVIFFDARRFMSQETIDAHFTPPYNPWDQRVCIIPDGDLFQTVGSGEANVVTGHIERFTENGIVMKDGANVDADIIVTATGLQMVMLSDIKVVVDKKEIRWGDTYSYKGSMFSGVPNMAQAFGHLNISWGCKTDMVSQYVCRLLNRMDDLGVTTATPTLTAEDMKVDARPYIDSFSSTYIQKRIHLFPKQLGGFWRNTQNFEEDQRMLITLPVDDPTLVFSKPANSANGAKATLNGSSKNGYDADKKTL